MKSISELKEETFKEYKKLTTAERLAKASWNEPYFNIKPTDKYGILYGSQCRIWIDRSGNIFKNKPSK